MCKRSSQNKVLREKNVALEEVVGLHSKISVPPLHELASSQGRLSSFRLPLFFCLDYIRHGKITVLPHRVIVKKKKGLACYVLSMVPGKLSNSYYYLLSQLNS